MVTQGNHKKQHHNSEKMEKSHEPTGHSNGNAATGTVKVGEKAAAAGPHFGEKSKNVSHVPCKFFRQSICQAGDKCPFSHDLDNEQQAVCKYFQKGNCKFGSKCALAHITPDGRQVNKRAKEVRRKDKKDDDSAHQDAVAVGNGSPQHGSPQHSRLNAGNSADYHSHGLAQGRRLSGGHQPSVLHAASVVAGSVSSSSSAIPVRSAKSKKSGSSSSQNSDMTVVDPSSVEMASQILSKFNDSSPRSGNPASFYGMSATSPRQVPLAMVPSSESSSRGMNSIRSISSSMPRGNHFALDGTGTHANAVWTEFRPGMVDGSAILDDDDEETLLGSLNMDDDDGFREQLVPSTLEDLLTPLERERRNSQQQLQKSGRVFSSPSSTKAVKFLFRRGSEPMSNSSGNYYQDPIGTPITGNFGPSSANSPMNMGVAKGNGGSGSDLWGPRNLDTPFTRANGFGSPTQAPPTMDSGSLFAASIKQTPYKFQNTGRLPSTSSPDSNLSSISTSSNPQDLIGSQQQSSYARKVSFSSPSNYPPQSTAVASTSQIPLGSPYLGSSPLTGYSAFSMEAGLYRSLPPQTEAVSERS